MASASLKSLTVTYGQGERIVASGEPGACMFVIQSGSVSLKSPGSESTPARDLGELEKGDFFGEAALLDGGPYTFHAEALSECKLVEISASTFHRMLESHPEIAVRMLRKLTARVSRLEKALGDSGQAAQVETKKKKPLRTAGAGSVKVEIIENAAKPTAPASAKGQHRLEVIGGLGVFPLVGDEMLVGRYDPVTDVQPGIDLSDIDNRRSVSRRHARLSSRDGQWFVAEEVGALNGTYLNGERLSPGRGTALKEGDVVSMGMVRMMYKAS